MSKLKVAELPKEEQEKLIAEMKEYKLGGIYTAYTVENAKKAIEKKKAEVQNQDGQTTPQSNTQEDQQGGENITEGQKDTDVENTEQKIDLNGSENTEQTQENATNDNNNIETIVPGDGGVHTVSTVDEQETDGTAQETPNDETDETKIVDNKETKTESKAKDAPFKICHICRSRVIDGVCSGCGFKF